MPMGTSRRTQPADTTGYGSWQLTQKGYSLLFDATPPVAISFKERDIDTTGIVFYGPAPRGYYHNSTFHIRGPDGPRGGRRMLCGQPLRKHWYAAQNPAPPGVIRRAANVGAWNAEWHAGYFNFYSTYATMCRTCARRLLLTSA